MVRIKKGTVLSWDTKSGRRVAKVTRATECLIFAQDTEGKEVIFAPRSLRKLIRQGIVTVEYDRRFRFKRCTVRRRDMLMTCFGRAAPVYARMSSHCCGRARRGSL